VDRTLPTLNAFVPYLVDAYRLLNKAEESEVAEDRTSLARSSTLHVIGALHAAANVGLWSQEDPDHYGSSLVRKFDRFLELRHQDALPDGEIAILEELDAVDEVISRPQVAQARPFPHPSKTNLIEFERTGILKISRESSGWLPEYSACVLALACGFLDRFYLDYCRMDRDDLEVLFGMHSSSSAGYAAKVDPRMIEDFRRQSENLQGKSGFLERLGSPRWKVNAEQVRSRMMALIIG
jgi:hypothetical protein